MTDVDITAAGRGSIGQRELGAAHREQGIRTAQH
jgi:hypothetical protein